MMEVATHGPLTRTHTAPAVHSTRMQNQPLAASPLMQTQSHNSSQYSVYSQPSLRLSDTTQGTSASTLFPPPVPSSSSVSTSITPAPIEASDNVINRVGDESQSLFPFCASLVRKLKAVPGVAEQLDEEERMADEDTDPVTLVWRFFRKGYPLVMILNVFNPANPVEVDVTQQETKKAKASTYKFLAACINDLRIPREECFILTDLYSDDTTGFTKVAKVVNRVLDMLAAQGLIDLTAEEIMNSTTAAGKRTQRQHIIHELVTTERTYVQHLELLQNFKKRAVEKGVITGDTVHWIFMNLDSLLDFQRRFLIRVEQTNSQPEAEQNWGKLFLMYKDGFRVYEAYIGNQKRCETTAYQEYDRLKDIGGPPEMRQMVESPAILSSFLNKPFQRLAKYPLLLSELQKKGDLNEEFKQDVIAGIEAAKSVLNRTNAAVDEEERVEAVEELKTRVEDWKGHRVEAFGSLLLFGSFTVLKGDNSSAKDVEREYKVYLFESILLCCKEINLNKLKNKNRLAIDKRGKPKLQLKGRIFMQNVTEIISFSKPGEYKCQIFWKGDPGIENFVIRFASEDIMKKWAQQVDTQRRTWREKARDSASQRGVSDQQFVGMENLNLENPYREDDDLDDDDSLGGTVPAPTQYYTTDLVMNRNPSNPSLRGRSGTLTQDLGAVPPPVGSSSSAHRMTPPRFPVNSLPAPSNATLALRTQQLAGHALSPGANIPDSYFSPAIESPISTRTSSSSGMYPFPRQQLPANNWPSSEDGNSRYTAPAVSRNPSRDTQGSMSSYTRPTSNRPSMNSATNQPPSQARLRSASSPDIANNPQARGVVPRSGIPAGAPDVPPFPQFVNAAVAPQRSQSNSPAGSHPRQMSAVSPAAYSPGYGYPANPTSALHRAATTAVPHSHIVAHTMGSPGSAQGGAASGEMPSQLKVKVHCPSAGCTYTLVVAINISYQSLKDRIDAKLQRSTNMSLAAGQLKLKYQDDGDYVQIQNDEDVQTAFDSWREQTQLTGVLGTGMGEIELFCQR